MPRGDRTGPADTRAGAGRGLGGGKGRGQGRGRRAGPGGNCVCPNCGETTPHQAGIPCFDLKCPKCGTLMARE